MAVENPSAFPFQGNDGCGNAMEPGYGMTLRDWFAGQALAGAMVGNWSSDNMTEGRAEMIAREVGMVADAMLAAREPTR